MLDAAFFAVGKFYLCPYRVRLWFILRLTWLFARGGVLRLMFFWFGKLSVPLGIIEMMVGLYEVADREVILPIVQARTTANDLFELDH